MDAICAAKIKKQLDFNPLLKIFLIYVTVNIQNHAAETLHIIKYMAIIRELHDENER